MSEYPANTAILRVGGPAQRLRRRAGVPVLDTVQATDDHAAQHSTGFFLFLLVNLVLFVRPAELFPDLEGLPIYEFTIAAALFASIPVVLRQLSWQSLVENPTTFFVLGLLPAIILSCLAHGDTWTARYATLEISKNLAYYVLLVGHVNSLSRLRTFSLFVFASILLMAIIVLLQWYGIIYLESLVPLGQAMAPDAAGNAQVVERVRGLGIFNDPNDLSLMLVIATMLALHFIATSSSRFLKVIWIIPLAPVLYVFALTRSRGGFLSLLAAIGTLLIARFGWRRAVLVGVLVAPLLIPFLGTRQTDIDIGDSNDTAQGRIHLWRDSLVLFHHAPLFGIGYGNLSDAIGLVAHNSFVHSFAELGLFGGTLFVGATFTPIFTLLKARGKIAPELSDWLPYLLAIIVGFVVGIWSLTRVYTVSTEMPLGILGAFCSIMHYRYPRLILRLDRQLLRKIIVTSLSCLVLLEFICRFMAA